MLYKNWTISPVRYVGSFDWQAIKGDAIIRNCSTIKEAKAKIDDKEEKASKIGYYRAYERD